MSFFKDLKEDIAQSVNELAESLDEGYKDEPEVFEDKTEEAVIPKEEPVLENSAEKELQLDFLPDQMDSMEMSSVDLDVESLEETVSEEEQPLAEPMPIEEFVPEAEIETEEQPVPEEINVAQEEPVEEIMEAELPKEEEPLVEEEAPVQEVTEKNDILAEEDNVMSEEMTMPVPEEEVAQGQAVTVITKGTTINGGISSDTSLVVEGVITGDVECEGKLTIKGRVEGNTIASEIYVQTPKLEGDINSKGIVKIDVGTVVIGNISCTSVLVSGAIKGNIEVNGPVIVDSTAVVKGDIKAKSIQINSGAVIDGHCSLQFADVDLDSFFE